MSSILVTGAAGFIGSNLVHHLHATHPDDLIIGFDSLTYAGNRANLQALESNPFFKFVHGDVRDFALLLKLIRDHHTHQIVHLAAETHVDRSIHGPDAFIDSNIIGTHVLLKAAKAVWLDAGSGIPHRF